MTVGFASTLQRGTDGGTFRQTKADREGGTTNLRDLHCACKSLQKLAPQAGFEPATLRLTAATPEIDRVKRSATKMMTISDLRLDTATEKR